MADATHGGRHSVRHGAHHALHHTCRLHGAVRGVPHGGLRGGLRPWHFAWRMAWCTAWKTATHDKSHGVRCGKPPRILKKNYRLPGGAPCNFTRLGVPDLFFVFLTLPVEIGSLLITKKCYIFQKIRLADI